MEDLSQELLLKTLNDLTGAINGVREKQDSMQTETNAALLETTRQVMSTGERVSLVDARVAGLESTIHSLKIERRKHALKWGAVGGAISGLAGGAAAVAKVIWGKG